MGKFQTVTFTDEKSGYSVTFTVDILTDGRFKTILPKVFVSDLKQAGIKVNEGGTRRPFVEGYYTDVTFAGLCKTIKDLFKDITEKEIVSETIILKYFIGTACSYVLNSKNEILPNGQWLTDEEEKSKKYYWKEGTFRKGMDRSAFELSIYIQAYVRRKYNLAGGRELVEDEPIYHNAHWKRTGKEIKMDYNLKFIAGIVHMEIQDDAKEMEIEYSEPVAKVFVDMIKSICATNEKIKEFTTPEHILQIAQKNQSLLSSKN